MIRIDVGTSRAIRRHVILGALVAWASSPPIALSTPFFHEVVDAVGDVGISPSIRIDGRGLAHVSYVDNTNQRLKYALRLPSGWITEIVDANQAIGYNSLALDASGNPRIA